MNSRFTIHAIAFIATFLIGSNFLVAELSAADSRTSQKKIRNVLLIVSDDLKASVLGCYGDKMCHTPNIDKLASSGMVFTRAYCQGTWCMPSRKSFMHSRYKDVNNTNLGEHLISSGYYSARVGKIYHMRVPGDIIAGTDGPDFPSTWTERFNSPGLEAHTPGNYACLNLNIFTTELEGRQSTGMKHRMFVSVDYEGDGSDQPDHKTATKTIELLQKHKDEPFFIAAGLVRPHYPMVAPQQYFNKYNYEDIDMPEVVDGDLDDIPKLGRHGTTNESTGIAKYPDNQKRMWAAYYAAVTFMDDQVGRILDELDRLNLRDTTAIVFISDHGYNLGEHTFWQKNNLHEEVTRVPMIISAPGYKPGSTDSIVELVDLYPTVFDLLEQKIPTTAQGTSLRPVLDDPAVSVKNGAISFARGVSIREKDFAYMLYNDGGEELYDMNRDPKQFTNLANNEEYSDLKTGMSKRLKDRLKELGLKEPGSTR